MNLQQLQNTIDGLIVIYKNWELLKAENARLRDVLQIIEQNELCNYGCYCGNAADQIARAALEDKE